LLKWFFWGVSPSNDVILSGLEIREKKVC